MTRPRPVWALYAFVGGLAAHNLAMAELWDAGVRGAALDVVSAWKDVLLLVALLAVFWRRRGLPLDSVADRLALGYGAFVVCYLLLPQSLLGGHAGGKTELYALRHDLLPVGAYFLGRGLDLGREERRRVAALVVGTACAVAAYGLADDFLVPLSWWRDSGAPGWFHQQLGLDYHGLSGLPENFVYNLGGDHVVRRLVSSFLSPLATSYLLVVALLLVAARRGLWLWAAPPLAAALLFTNSRSSILALALGLVALAWGTRTWLPAALAVAWLAVGVASVKAFPHLAPETHFTAPELVIQHRGAAGESHDPLSGGESSTSSHWRNLRDGVSTVVHHPQGFGLGNAGVTAFRTGTKVEAGESTYTELGVETGLLGALVFVAWSVALVRRVLPGSAWIGASLVAVLALGIQTDVIGVPWLAYVLWALAGDRA